MTRGEIKKVALALYKVAVVEESINDVTVWAAMGEDGINNVWYLQEAMSELSHVISEHVDYGISRRSEQKKA